MQRMLILLLVAWVFFTAPLESTESTAVVWEGDVAGIDMHFETLNPPKITPAGQPVFGALLSGDAISSDNDYGMWMKEASLIKMCQEGYAYPAAGAGVTASCPGSGSVNTPISSSPPKVFGFTWLTGDGVTTSNDTVLTYFEGWATGSTMVAREGDAAPGTDGYFIPGSSGHCVAPNGTVAFISGLQGGTDTVGIWTGPPAAVTLRVKAGDPAPGLGEPFQGFSQLVLSDLGLLAFSGYTASGSWGVYRGPATTLMVRDGTTMPGGGNLTGANSLAINHRGELVFKGSLDNGRSGIYTAAPGDVRAVAYPGMPAPDYGTFYSCGFPTIGASGDICFWAQMSSGADGIYCNIDETLQLIAREDDTPPALDPGETVGGFYWYPVVNRYGQVLFISQVNTGSDFQLTWWLRKTDGQLEPIVRRGQPLEITPGIFKTVYDLYLPTGGSPRPSIGGGDATVFNDRGEITFWAEFTDGSKGIFVNQPEAMDPTIVFEDGFENGTSGAWN